MGSGDRMRQFVDNAERSWTVEINVDAIRRVRGLTGVNLIEAIDGELATRLMRDPVLLCDVLYAVCKPAADKGGITDEDFGRSMRGDVIEHATKALLEELVDFSPNPRDRANLGKVIETMARVQDRARDLVEAKLAGGALEHLAETELAKIESQLERLNAGSGSAPESSG